jgi:hypothetical protein
VLCFQVPLRLFLLTTQSIFSSSDCRLQSYVNVNMNDEGGIDGFQMEPAEKMSATRSACMPFWLGDNVSHIAGDGEVITNASSSHIRSSKQDDIYGTSHIVLPCPGS